MSGRKESEYRLREERERKLRLVQRVGSLHSEVEALKQRIEAALAGASSGLRATFAAEVERAERWVKQLELPKRSGLGMNASDAALNAARKDLERLSAEGQEVHEALAVALTRKADEMGKQLSRRLARARTLYLGRQELLRLWFPQQAAAWERELEEAERLLSREQYKKAEEALAAIEGGISEKTPVAGQQEEKHQKRLYLVESLRQVCRDLGFKEIAAPRPEQESQRGSPIRFTVDTRAQGQIAFTITLEGISSDSEVLEDRCLDEFGQLSKILEEEFGVQTEFHRAGEARPVLKHKEAKALPKAAGRQAQKG